MIVAGIAASTTLIGTLGGTVMTQRYALRAKRLDAENQRRDRNEQRQEEARTVAADRMRSIYAELNTCAHYFRSAARRYLADRARGGSAESADFDTAWEKYRESYAQAQMVLSERALTIASAVGRCMDDAREAVIDIDISRADDLTNLDNYLYKSLGNAVRMLRHTLRADLGAEPQDEVPIGDRVAELRHLRYRGRGQGTDPQARIPV